MPLGMAPKQCESERSADSGNYFIMLENCAEGHMTTGIGKASGTGHVPNLANPEWVVAADTAP